ncbi:hypothetical protein ACLBWT_13135 [Paenibacillus sp. D51F]
MDVMTWLPPARLLASADPVEGTGVYWAHGRVNADRAASEG